MNDDGGGRRRCCDASLMPKRRHRHRQSLINHEFFEIRESRRRSDRWADIDDVISRTQIGPGAHSRTSGFGFLRLGSTLHRGCVSPLFLAQSATTVSSETIIIRLVARGGARTRRSTKITKSKIHCYRQHQYLSV